MDASPNSIFERMRESYLAARGVMNSGTKSAHWDVFPGNYDTVFDRPDDWPGFLRNALSIGFNDDFSAFYPGGDLGPGDGDGGLWPLRHAHDYRELLPAKLTDRAQLEQIGAVAQLICSVCGPEFVFEQLMPEIGSPAVTQFEFEIPGSECQRGRVNFHDLSLIYHAWQTWRGCQDVLTGEPLIIEIGGGYGGMAAKLKDLLPAAHIALFDLPEVNAVQSYYLASRFPGAELLLYSDTLRNPDRFAAMDFDFAVLPGSEMTKLADASVDLALNIRSMMEMTGDAITSYFNALHRTVRPGGLFLCINRYDKAGIRLKDYPFDGRWRIRLSQASIGQAHIHELLVERTVSEQPFPVATALQSLPPFG